MPFSGKASDVWQFGQLLITTFFGNAKNTKIVRQGNDYKVMSSKVGEFFADLVAGCTDEPGLRYTMKQVIDHPFFTLASMVKFNINIKRERTKQLLQNCKQLIRRASTPNLL